MNKAELFEKIRNYAIGEFAVGVYNKYKFRTESSLYNGKQISKSEHPSIIHFSFNKAATQYTKDILKQMAQPSGMTCVDYNNYAFYTNAPYLDQLSKEEFESYQHLFQPKGYLYSVFGGAINGVRNFNEYKVVLMVRDPRDMLVSAYFSMKYSHPKPGKDSDKNENFHQLRERALRMEIDEYVLSNLDYYTTEFEKYNTTISIHPNLHITRFEDMVSDRKRWLKDLAKYCELDASVIQLQTAEGHQENKKSHNRKGIAGDYLEKLRPETIREINTKLSAYLNQYGYE